MLNPSEKAYCQALLALRRKEYQRAAEQFEKAVPFFRKDEEFNLFRETTRLLLTVKEELARLEKQNELQIEEVFTDG